MVCEIRIKALNGNLEREMLFCARILLRWFLRKDLLIERHKNIIFEQYGQSTGKMIS